MLAKERGVFLITVNANLEYDIKFEWNDLEKWKISKLDGRTGIPEGI